MKLSATELDLLAAQVAARGERCIPGQPGSRIQPLSYSALLAERRRLMGERS